MEQKRPPIWKRKYLISRKFQLKYVWLVIVSFIIVIGLVLWDIHKMLKTLMPCVQMMEMAPEIAKSEMLLLVKVSSIMVILALLMVYLTFKIAGPLFRIEKEIRSMLDTKEYKNIKIRQGDEAQELVELLNKLINQIKGVPDNENKI